MERSASDLSRKEAYFLLIDSIVPRPVAWVSTASSQGVGNLAPFSFFTGISASPPTLALSIAAKRLAGCSGDAPKFTEKDTLRNIRDRREFIVHLAPGSRREDMKRTAVPEPPEVDESLLLGMTSVPGTWVDLPRFPELPVAMECRLHQLIPLGTPATHLVLGEILGWHVHDSLLDDKGRVWADRWHPIARLGVDGFASNDLMATKLGQDD